MIRVYLDKCIYSHFKNGMLTDLSEFLKNHNNEMIVCFSPALMLDMVNYDHNSQVAKAKLQEEFPFIDSVANKHLVKFNSKKNRIECYLIKPSEYVDYENEDYITNNITLADNPYMRGVDHVFLEKIISKTSNQQKLKESLDAENQTHLFDAFSKDGVFDRTKLCELRKSVNSKYKVDINEQDCVKHLQEKLLSDAIFLSDIICEFRKLLNLPNDDLSSYKSIYILIDLFTKNTSDSKNNLDSILKDAEHSFFALHCNFLISCDKGLIAKSIALARYLNKNVQSLFISPKSNEIIEYQNNAIHILSKSYENVYDLRKLMSSASLEYSYSDETYCEERYHINNYLNFYDVLILIRNQTTNNTCFIFRRDMTNSYYYLFTSEFDQVFSNIQNQFTSVNKNELRKLRDEFILQNTSGFYAWDLSEFVGLVCVDPTEKYAIIPQLLFFTKQGNYE